MRKLLLVSLLVILSGCAGTGFEKKATLMPDSIGIEGDMNPQDGFRSREVTGRATWNLK